MSDSDQQQKVWDAIIIGGGAAGLMACASAAQRGRRVLLLEKNSKLGVKILMSGGTRCNITHDCGPREIVEAFGDNGRFLHSALAALPPEEVVRLIESSGVATKVEPGGKIFPVSDRAVDVRDALYRLAFENDAGSKYLLRQPVREIRSEAGEFIVRTNDSRFVAASLVIATGGKSWPKCGTTGDAYAWAKQLGHLIVQPVPALTPIVNNGCWTHELKGITLPDVRLQTLSPPETADTSTNEWKVLDQRRGSFLFTHFGYSGPVALDISKSISRSPRQNSLLLKCDFVPDESPQQFAETLGERLKSARGQSLANVLNQIFPRRFVERSLVELRLPGQQRAAETGKQPIAKLVEQFKSARFPIGGTIGFSKAEVTAGGVCLDGIDSRTMQSRICPGLYIVGEALDLDGPIGGYNFQSAFSTGWLAGLNI